MSESKSESDCALRSVTLTVDPCSMEGLREVSEQLRKIGDDHQSAAHSIAARQIRWAIMRINRLESTLASIGEIAVAGDRQ